MRFMVLCFTIYAAALDSVPLLFHLPLDYESFRRELLEL